MISAPALYAGEDSYQRGSLRAGQITSDEWITTRTGRSRNGASRRQGRNDQRDMAAKAALRKAERAGEGFARRNRSHSPSPPATPDMIFPRDRLFRSQEKSVPKMPPASMFRPPALDSRSELRSRSNSITSGTYDTALVIGADKLNVDHQLDRSKYAHAFQHGDVGRRRGAGSSRERARRH